MSTIMAEISSDSTHDTKDSTAASVSVNTKIGGETEIANDGTTRVCAKVPKDEKDFATDEPRPIELKQDVCVLKLLCFASNVSDPHELAISKGRIVNTTEIGPTVQFGNSSDRPGQQWLKAIDEWASVMNGRNNTHVVICGGAPHFVIVYIAMQLRDCFSVTICGQRSEITCIPSGALRTSPSNDKVQLSLEEFDEVPKAIDDSKDAHTEPDSVMLTPRACVVHTHESEERDLAAINSTVQESTTDFKQDKKKKMLVFFLTHAPLNGIPRMVLKNDIDTIESKTDCTVRAVLKGYLPISFDTGVQQVIAWTDEVVRQVNLRDDIQCLCIAAASSLPMAFVMGTRLRPQTFCKTLVILDRTYAGYYPAYISN